jgi:hypothetical protein
MKLFLVEGHNVAEFPKTLYDRLRAMVPAKYDIIAAHERANGTLVAWCQKPNDDDLLKFTEGVVVEHRLCVRTEQ